MRQNTKQTKERKIKRVKLRKGKAKANLAEEQAADLNRKRTATNGGGVDADRPD